MPKSRNPWQILSDFCASSSHTPVDDHIFDFPDHPGQLHDPFEDIPLPQETLDIKAKSLDVTVSSPLGDKLVFDCMIGSDTLSSLYIYHLRLYSTSADLDLSAILGKNMTVCVASMDGKKKRYFSGLVTHARSLPVFSEDPDTKTYRAYYSVILQPTLWLATLNKNFRVFMKKKTKEIIESVLKEDGISFTNKASSSGNTVREYCLQYNESNFHFVSRLMEEEGIFYFFEHGPSGEKMILADANKSASALDDVSMMTNPSLFTNSIFRLNSQTRLVTKKFSAVDYDYMKPDTTLKTSGSGSSKAGEIYEYPGLFLDSGVASKVGPRRIQSIGWPENLIYGRGSVIDFVSGSTFKLTQHTRKALNQKYLIYSVRFFIQQRPNTPPFQSADNLPYINSFTALPNDIPFVPLRKTPKTRIDSVQTAVVVGPQGKEIYSDNEGRVFVQFLWDREGKKDGKNSCPVRCMQGWAGPGFGLAFVPRIGMEVLVAFENGDPDRPIIVGCLYNGKNSMPETVTKEPRIAMLKTKTSTKDGNKANIMSFDDTKDAEKITFNATKDYELSSKADDNLFLLQQDGKNTTTKFYVNEGLVASTIKKGENTFTIEEGNDSILLKKGSRTITLENGDYVLKISKGTLTVTAKKDITISTDASLTVSAKKDMTFKANGGITISAQKDISIKSNSNITTSSLKDTQIKATKNIDIKATMAINIKATTDVKISALNCSVKATLSAKIEGLTTDVKATLQLNCSALMAKLSGTVTADVSGLSAKVSGAGLAALSGALTAIG